MTGEVNNIKRPGRAEEATKVDDDRVLSLEKYLFTTWRQVGNRVTIKRMLSDASGNVNTEFTTTCKNYWEHSKNKKDRLDFPSIEKKPPKFWNKNFLTDETEIIFNQNDGEEKSGEETAADPQQHIMC